MLAFELERRIQDAIAAADVLFYDEIGLDPATPPYKRRQYQFEQIQKVLADELGTHDIAEALDAIPLSDLRERVAQILRRVSTGVEI